MNKYLKLTKIHVDWHRKCTLKFHKQNRLKLIPVQCCLNFTLIDLRNLHFMNTLNANHFNTFSFHANHVLDLLDIFVIFIHSAFLNELHTWNSIYNKIYSVIDSFFIKNWNWHIMELLFSVYLYKRLCNC